MPPVSRCPRDALEMPRLRLEPIGTAEEVSAAAVFLLSEGAAYTSGATFLVDGKPARQSSPPWQRPTSAPAPPQGAPGGFEARRPQGERPRQWASRHCLECAS